MRYVTELRTFAIASFCIMTLAAGCAGSPTQESTGEYVDDSVITTKVKTELLSQEGFKSLDISVETFKGKVQLSGFVNTARQREKAEAVTRSVKGVVEVENSLLIK